MALTQPEGDALVGQIGAVLSQPPAPPPDVPSAPYAPAPIPGATYSVPTLGYPAIHPGTGEYQQHPNSPGTLLGNH